jgi:hypothetical protein
MKAKLTNSSLCELFHPSEKITGESVSKTIEEIKTMKICELREIARTEFFSKLNGLMKKCEEDSKMTLLLTLFVEEVAYKGAIHSAVFEGNHFSSEFIKSKFDVEFESRMLKQEKEKEKEEEEETEKEKERGKEGEKEKEKEKKNISQLLLHSALTYSLMMKSQELNKSIIPIIVPILLSSISSHSTTPEDRINRTRSFLALRRMCEDYGLTSLFIFKFSFLLFLLIQTVEE